MARRPNPSTAAGAGRSAPRLAETADSPAVDAAAAGGATAPPARQPAGDDAARMLPHATAESPAGDAETALAPAASREAATHIRIAADRDGFRRAGRAHPKAPTVHPLDRFSADELEAIEAESMLRVAFLAPAGAGGEK